MNYITKKSITDSIFNTLLKFSRTDEDRPDEDYISYKIDQVREQMIVAKFQDEKKIDRAWLSDMGNMTFHKVNYPDDANLTTYCSTLSKCFIPNVISLNRDGIDLGIVSLRSVGGTAEYTFFPMSEWQNIPTEHVRSKFPYYDRINTSLYVNREVSTLRLIAMLSRPEDGYLIQSEPQTAIVPGTQYIVRFGSIVYNGVVKNDGDTFTGFGSTTFTGNGKVYLKSQLTAISETKPYPITGEMARMIELEILKVEFGIEQKQEADRINDSVDDETK